MQKLLYRIMQRRHFWRYATFSEVAELYVSRLLRMIGVNLSTVFMSMYLYQNGYSVIFIGLYIGVYCLAKAIIALPLAKYVAKYGPKHAILLSNLLYIPAIVIFSQSPKLGFPALVLTGMFLALSAPLYNMAYYIDFSKVKIPEHAGKEIAYMNIFEKIATGVSPLIGGLIAYTAGPVATMMVAATFFLVSAIPLFRTSEPIETGHQLAFRGFPWRVALRSIVANFGVGFDVVASNTAWILLVGIAIVGFGTGDKIYAVMGGLASLIIFADILFSYGYGLLIDRKHGGALMKGGLFIDVATHLVRPFTQNIFTAGLINISNEAGTTGYMMAFTRGMFDIADKTGHRVTYIGFVEIMQDIGAAVAAFLISIMVALMGVQPGLRNYFFVAALFMLSILIARFPLYHK